MSYPFHLVLNVLCVWKLFTTSCFLEIAMLQSVWQYTLVPSLLSYQPAFSPLFFIVGESTVLMSQWNMKGSLTLSWVLHTLVTCQWVVHQLLLHQKLKCSATQIHSVMERNKQQKKTCRLRVRVASSRAGRGWSAIMLCTVREDFPVGRNHSNSRDLWIILWMKHGGLLENLVTCLLHSATTGKCFVFD